MANAEQYRDCALRRSIQSVCARRFDGVDKSKPGRAGLMRRSCMVLSTRIRCKVLATGRANQ